MSRSLRIQLWSHSFAPEPTGIGPINTVWARGLRELGHEVEVVAAHPHYPEPRWGVRILPYREVQEDIPLLRLPMWVGRASTFERYRQELTFAMALASAAPFLRRPDVLVSTSPMFGALLPAVAEVRARRIPWVLWLHDLLPDGAAATGLVEERGAVMSLARRFERLAYRTADRIVVLSRSFTDNLLGKGVPPEKIDLIYDPATRFPRRTRQPKDGGFVRILSMGNIGFSQGLAPVVRAFESHPELPASLAITGTGVAIEEVRAEVRSERLEVLGLVDDERLESELNDADIGLVTQRYEGPEFNIPSKLMNFMAYGLPILAVVDPKGEVARIIEEAEAGWVADSRDIEAFPRLLARLQHDRDEISRRGAKARAHANAHFTPATFASRFESTLKKVVSGSSR